MTPSPLSHEAPPMLRPIASNPPVGGTGNRKGTENLGVSMLCVNTGLDSRFEQKSQAGPFASDDGRRSRAGLRCWQLLVFTTHENPKTKLSPWGGRGKIRTAPSNPTSGGAPRQAGSGPPTLAPAGGGRVLKIRWEGGPSFMPPMAIPHESENRRGIKPSPETSRGALISSFKPI